MREPDGGLAARIFFVGSCYTLSVMSSTMLENPVQASGKRVPLCHNCLHHLQCELQLGILFPTEFGIIPAAPCCNSITGQLTAFFICSRCSGLKAGHKLLYSSIHSSPGFAFVHLCCSSCSSCC